MAAFFLIGAIGNIFVSEQIAADYARWRYPGWFHYLTGFLELIVAMLLALKSLRFWGAVLGAVVMIAASSTVALHREYAPAIAPLVVLALSVAVGWWARSKR